MTLESLVELGVFMEAQNRNAHDGTAAGPFASERESLTPLSSLDWKVSDGEPDIRGWEVRTISGRQLGAVADLLVDAASGEVALLDLDLAESDRHTFVPMRAVQIDRARRVILMDSADIPDARLSRSDRRNSASAPRSISGEFGVVRYPAYDREVHASRPALADVAAPESGELSGEASGERRQGERRRIDRMSTDL